jgi:hypothetical protein
MFTDPAGLLPNSNPVPYYDWNTGVFHPADDQTEIQGKIRYNYRTGQYEDDAGNTHPWYKVDSWNSNAGNYENRITEDVVAAYFNAYWYGYAYNASAVEKDHKKGFNVFGTLHKDGSEMVRYAPKEWLTRKFSGAIGSLGNGDYYDWKKEKVILDYTGATFGGLETIVRPQNKWLGKNGKYYKMSWGGNQYTGARSKAISAANAYKWAGRATTIATVAIGGVEVYNGYKMDGNSFGYNANSAAAQTIGGVAGGWVGAEAGATIGAGIGAWFGGIGTVPGAGIGGVFGGVFGGNLGSEAAQESVDWYYDK